MHYVHSHHLGSLNVLTDENGAIEQELSFDAWGNRRNPYTGSKLTATELAQATTLTSRGITGHEHIDGMELRYPHVIVEPLISEGIWGIDGSFHKGWDIPKVQYRKYRLITYINGRPLDQWIRANPNDPPGLEPSFIGDLISFAPLGILKAGLSRSVSSVAETGIEVTQSSIAKALEGSTNLVYHGLDAAGTVRYVGITERAAAVRFGEHLSSGTAKSLLDFRVIDGATGLSRTGARVWEQTLINQYGLGKNGGQLLNKVNSIAPKNWW